MLLERGGNSSSKVLKKKVVAITEGRMTYGLLYWTLKALEQHQDFELHLVVTGSHLSKAHGYTVQDIEKEQFTHLYKLESLSSEKGNTKVATAKALGRITVGLAKVLSKVNPDLMIILGDRYELLAAASTATIMNIPIAHVCGGEISEGAFDEQIRHALTKLSHLHFTGCEEYQKNVISLGEKENHVFNVGEPGIENIKRLNLLSKHQLLAQLQIENADRPIFLITYHPVTLEGENKDKISNLVKALSRFDATQIITAPNQDPGGSIFLNKLKEYAQVKENVYLFSSLGQLKYLSVMNIAEVVIGNSSSGIIETPSFKVPTVNIGNRQQGRLRSPNIIDCAEDASSIISAINKAKSPAFKKQLLDLTSPFGEGKTSQLILEKLSQINDYSLLLKKSLARGKNEY